MKELKFRAWDKKKNMATNFMILDNTIKFMDKNTGVWFGETQERYKDFELMQYTGLKDKNGVDIFEGDIVKDVIDDMLGNVEYSDGLYLILYKDVVETLNEYETKYIEVVGNKYENKEVLGDEY